MSSVLVDMRRITKHFPGVRANEAIDFQVQQGEIHALLGENGAGKSTLMSILSGLYRPDQGEIWLHGCKVTLKSPREALANGVGMVYQHFRLVEPLTVTENVILGTKGTGWRLDRRRLAEKVGGYAKEYGLEVDPAAKVWQLSVGEKQRVEILKLLYRGADILILDEPTAVLTPQEVRQLFQTLRRMADDGKAVILITHKLQEVMEVADRITVLRKGMKVGTVGREETDEKKLTRMMVNREVLFSTARRHKIGQKTILSLEHLVVRGDREGSGLKDLSLEVRAGEILGIAGIAGNGQRELSEALTGLRPVSGGKLIIEGKDYTNRSPRSLIKAGVSAVPEDRLGTGLVPNLNLYDNLILKDYYLPPISRHGMIARQQVVVRAKKLVEQFSIQVSDLSYPVRMLSGGNLQRLLLAREIQSRPRLLVASYPVRGLDVGATESVYQLLLELCAAGTAILLISEDLDEIMTLSDRIAVLFRGEVMGILPAAEAKIEQLGLMMVGERKTEVEVG